MRTIVRALLFVLLSGSSVWAQIHPICDSGCGGSDPSSPGMVTARTAVTATRGIGTLTRPTYTHTPPKPISYPNPALSKTIAIQGSQSYTYTVPLFALPGRSGLDLNLSLYYNSFVWTASGRAITLNADHDTPSIGFRLDLGYIEWDGTIGDTGVLVEPSGAKHLIAGTANPNIATTTDGSYIQVYLPNTVAASPNMATFKNGLQINYTYAQGFLFRPTQVEDTNGNLITISYLNNTNMLISSVTDTVGRALNFFYDSSGTMLQCVTTASNCSTPNTQTFTFTWNTNYILNFNFGAMSTGTQIHSGSTALNVLTGVKRPDGTSVSFSYGDWGIVNKIQELSSSGNPRSSVSYNFPSASAGALSSNPAYTQETIFDGVNTGTWNFQATTDISNNVTALAVTDPCGTVTTTSTPSGGLPTQVQISSNQPASPGPGCPSVLSQTWRTVNQTWTSDSVGNPLLANVTTILEDNSQAQVIYKAYDSNGNPTDKLQYDFGAGAPGTLLEEVLTSYAPLANHILDRVADVQIKDGSGNTIFHEKRNYDEVAVQAVSPLPVMRDETNYSPSGANARGNLTSTIAYTNPAAGSGPITSRFTYDETGNQLTSNIGCCTPQQKNFSIATQYAYPDSVVNGPSGNQLSTTYAYNIGTGTVASITDANSQKTTFGYDIDNRLTSRQGPDLVTHNFSYDDSGASPATAESSTANSLVMRLIFNGAGGGLSRQVLNGNTTVSTVSYVNDILERPIQISTPYAPASTPVYHSVAYDPLDRVTQSTPPANSGFSQNSYTTQYAGNSVTFSDPAGRQRKHYSDALGRLVRVDEPGQLGGSAGAGSITISGSEQTASTPTGGGATPGTGSVTVGGSENSTQVLTHAATTASGSVTINGAEQCFTPPPPPPPTCRPPMPCCIGVFHDPWQDGKLNFLATAALMQQVCDFGTITITVNGHGDSYSFGSGDTTSTIASHLAQNINNDGGAFVWASASGATVSLTSRATGSAANYSLSSSYSFDSGDFSSSSFTTSNSGSALTGGTNNTYQTVYNTGTVKITVTQGSTSYSKSYNYGQNDTASSVASYLTSQIHSDTTFPVDASLSGTLINLTTRATGNGTGYPLATSATTTSQYFSSSAFTATASGANLTSGQNGVVSDAGTVAVSISGFTEQPYSKTVNYGVGSTAATVSNAIMLAFNNDSMSPVNASISSSTPNVVALAAKSLGSDTNYSVAVSSATSQGTYFSQPSFTGSAASLSSGTDPVTSISTPMTTTYKYDPLGDLLQVSQGQQTRAYVYDGLGRMTSATLPETANQSLTYAYTDFGAVSQRTDPRVVSGSSITTNYGYDTLNRIQTITYNDGTPNITYTYNPPGASNNTGGRLVSVTNGVASQVFKYDVMGRTTQSSETIGGNSYVTGYGYNPDGTVASLTYPSGRVVASGYDSIGRLTQLGTGGTGVLNVTSYNGANQILGINYGNGMSATYSYNNQLQIASILYGNSSSTLLSLAYNYGGSQDNGQIQGITDNAVSARSTTYAYDPLGRLKLAQTNDLTSANTWKLKFSYDRYSNRLSEIPVAGTATMPLNEVSIDPTTNRLLGSPYSYDAAGNLLTDGTNSYTFDAENRMTSVNPAPGLGLASFSLRYDPFGVRVSKGSTYYIYSGGQLIAEYANGAAAASPSAEYVNFGGQHVANIVSGALTYNYADHLSIRVAADSGGNVVRSYTSYPFGETQQETGTASRRKFTVYDRDESGLDYAYARYYASSLGRFSSMDPESGDSGNPQSLNRYTYVLDNPINFTDPTGMVSKLDLCMLSDTGDVTTKCAHLGPSQDILTVFSLGAPDNFDADKSLKNTDPFYDLLTDGVPTGDPLLDAEKQFDSDVKTLQNALRALDFLNLAARIGAISNDDYNAVMDILRKTNPDQIPATLITLATALGFAPPISVSPAPSMISDLYTKYLNLKPITGGKPRAPKTTVKSSSSSSAQGLMRIPPPGSACFSTDGWLLLEQTFSNPPAYLEATSSSTNVCAK